MRFPFTFLSRLRNNSRIPHFKNFTIYYGQPDDRAMAKLSQFDLIIIEPHLFTKEQIHFLQEKKVLVVGYISIMQAPTWNTKRIEQLKSSDYLMINGRKRHYPQWDTYLMDLREKNYQSLLLEEIDQQIFQKQLTGLFLDTVDDIDDQIQDSFLQSSIRTAYIQVLEQIRGRCSELTLIQNRGFFTLEFAFPYVDGLLWEDWQGNWKNNAWIKERVKLVSHMQKKGLCVLSLSSDHHPIHQKEAEKLGFVHTNNQEGYDSL